MVRPHRIDAPGRWWHVFNRGVARRTMFESRADVRYFLSLVARCVRAGLIEVHAYSILPTHFHLFVRSRVGRLSDAMKWIQDHYSRWFNRTRRRDGPLVRGRFGARVVDSSLYCETLLRYIDLNPVEARIVERAADYPWSSAGAYAGGRRPPWLDTSVLESLLAEYEGVAADERLGVFHRAAPSASVRHMIDRRIAAQPAGDSLDDLVGAAPLRVRQWMDRKARLADGTDAGEPVLAPESVREAVARLPPVATDRVPHVRGAHSPARNHLEAGLLRWGAGLRLDEIAVRQGVSSAAVRGRLAVHARAVRSDEGYAALLAAAFAIAASIDHGATRKRWRLPTVATDASTPPPAFAAPA